ncbi:MAG: pyridoxamine 5'-phosphate oxidase family protein [Anabaena sp. CoA2_C59]|jgi:general stress protein 26|nr:pyridoxamine 5'-phosphate oxidase family protein [Anabaena sp. CoA2_C59]MDJ0507281.1 pyridoxamine 5'-phosphate oxidase family protein [Nostocales cyanobacterium LE14-WE12]OBQ27981.1 MAG: pyridoxamine 5'-phosphate oxidase [Aphanizomenon flos-aquae MDT14a]QSV66617.1 MAG: pyridoxamine 5'-phosphate oxidase family protein [Aphanizomenon flos-aquae DEX188]
MTQSLHTKPQVQELRKLLEDIECGMLTTIDNDGSLHSRPMSMWNEIDNDATLWFFTLANSHKVVEIQHHQQVNISFSAPNQERYVSILGIAELIRDRNQLQSKWQPGLETWFPQGIDEPNIALLKVKVNKVDYWESSSSFVPQTINFLELSHR